MKRTFQWELTRDADGRGLTKIAGSVVANDVPEARCLIGQAIDQAARQGHVKGHYTLALRDERRSYAARHLYVQSARYVAQPVSALDQAKADLATICRRQRA